MYGFYLGIFIWGGEARQLTGGGEVGLCRYTYMYMYMYSTGMQLQKYTEGKLEVFLGGG